MSSNYPDEYHDNRSYPTQIHQEQGYTAKEHTIQRPAPAVGAHDSKSEIERSKKYDRDLPSLQPQSSECRDSYLERVYALMEKPHSAASHHQHPHTAASLVAFQPEPLQEQLRSPSLLQSQQLGQLQQFFRVSDSTEPHLSLERRQAPDPSQHIQRMGYFPISKPVNSASDISPFNFSPNVYQETNDSKLFSCSPQYQEVSMDKIAQRQYPLFNQDQIQPNQQQHQSQHLIKMLQQLPQQDHLHLLQNKPFQQPIPGENIEQSSKEIQQQQWEDSLKHLQTILLQRYANMQTAVPYSMRQPIISPSAQALYQQRQLGLESEDSNVFQSLQQSGFIPLAPLGACFHNQDVGQLTPSVTFSALPQPSVLQHSAQQVRHAFYSDIVKFYNSPVSFHCNNIHPHLPSIM